ncbi:MULTISPECIES: aminotransferase class V-fold PLP-dependent enzyme [Idiomarina]|uniref:aminotransferase class V-fold PLP-dependent enzyme n=1 Tax=Idiomarina TaxID=135575 RepID=UPI00129CBCE0|nr:MULTISPECIES: aminotransferase class V-fold PLP-dependent enzyme [Idiomarina]MRJ42769.1 aminotransferase class V-fold PLP-dependent enzyme [Idiomarina sp. FeN1]NCU58321.1 aminotransferase class V-fold PLP-dependent enzyme [Idiomarina sp. FenA--70]NCU61019.1 aminotransferase class V-fold PLP-dependent enzyme [Idiomarina sp. FenBw--71]UUN12972.1 aminotransferase class V-fold PLP-dependent enzyme [Idiomarina loihiensis]
MSYKQYYQGFFQRHPDSLHCAPHSHHYWPDVTRAAQLQYWDDTAQGVDHKWNQIFGERVPAVQTLLAELLQHPHPEQFVFASNTHELLYRVMSCFDLSQPVSILTTDSEFHSFSRQLRRLQERSNLTVTVVATEPFASFPQRWLEAVTAQAYTLIFTSQVFYNSGVVGPDLNHWVPQADPASTIVVDGYHGCGAIPTNLSAVADRIFYLAGAYKYLQAGEGCCFMAVPKGCQLRPEYTGWFADFANLAKPQQGEVQYADDGLRFAGSTMDLSALYRLESVLQWWQQEQLSVDHMHGYVQQLQQGFLAVLDEAGHPLVNRQRLLVNSLAQHGHFFTFCLDNPDQVQQLAEKLAKAGIETDYRGNRLRFGFALYHDVADYQRLKKALSSH